MGDRPYDDLASVYEWLVPEALLTPEGSAEAFSMVVGELRGGARVLDCAAGTGELAVGLALHGFDVTATDASGAMVERTRALACTHGVEVRAARCAWEELAAQGWDGSFDAVLCVGNSLTHAAGSDARRAALVAMAGVLREGGLLALTSRNWERLRAARPRLDVEDRLVERGGRPALVVRAWTIPDSAEAAHELEVAVALLDGAGGVETRSERLSFWPFGHDQLQAELRSAGLVVAASTYADDAERYLVTARRSAAGAHGGSPPRPARP
jgi:SAM-dependent methyltransferase